MPGDEVEEIGAHRQAAVGEVERFHRAVAERIGKGLQENVSDFHVVDTLDQLIDIFALLNRVFIVDIIEIDVHHPNRLTLLDLRHLAGEGLDRRIAGDKQTGNVIQIPHIAQTIAEGKRQLIAAAFRDSQRCAVGGAVGPYPGARRFAGDVGDFVAHFAHVGIDALVKLLVAFVASAGLIIKAVGNRRFAAALRIGLNTVV